MRVLENFHALILCVIHCGERLDELFYSDGHCVRIRLCSGTGCAAPYLFLNYYVSSSFIWDSWWILTSLLTELLSQSVLEDDLSSVRRCGPEGQHTQRKREILGDESHNPKQDEVLLLEVD